MTDRGFPRGGVLNPTSATLPKTEASLGGIDGNNGQLDAFARLRVSQPTTLFDSKQINDNKPLFWDDQETSGSGTSSTYVYDKASSDIAVSNLTAGTRIRQTKMRFNYQPGKGHLILLTGILGGGAAGIKTCIGYYDDENGLFFLQNNGTLKVVKRSKVSGSVVDTEIAQTSWNLNKMDGSDIHGITLDTSKTLIFFIDFEWLGVGSVRFGVFIDGSPYYVHQMNHANNLTEVYMRTPNLPCRYEIQNDGSGPAYTMQHICTSVMSEGGQEELGNLRYFSTKSTKLDANSIGTIYALIGIRLKSTHLDSVIKELKASILATTSDNFEWIVLFNPTVAGTFTYNNLTDSGVQVALGVTANTVTGGVELNGGYVNSSEGSTEILPTSLWLGSTIDEIVDEIVLCIRPLGANLDVYGSITWRELS